MEPTNGLSSLKIALLIDFDNVLLGIDDPGFDVELVVNALRERGSIVMGRCYGDWYRHNRHRRKLMEQGLELVETPAFGPVIKNSADIRIALDGLEIGMTQHHIDTFCLVSGDSDFLPLIKKLQYLGKQVLVICGNRFTSDMLRRNCNEFISYENLLAQSVGATEDATTLEGAFALLHRAMEALRERGSEIRSSTVKQMMLQLNPTFSERNFGYPQFRGFLDKAVAHNLIKLGGRDRVSGEFSVLLPEEEDAKPETEAPKFEIKNPEVKAEVRAPREPRAPRAPREPRGKTPVASETAPVEPAVLPPGTDLFAPASASETDDHSTTASSLVSRGLRRGRLRFSGKEGKPQRIEVPFEEIFADAPENPAPNEENNSLEAESEPIIAENAPLEAVAETVEAAFAEMTETVAPPIELGAAPEAEEAEAAPKKTRARRRRKSPNAEKGVAETSPASESEAQNNEIAADAAGLSIPGEAIEVTEPEVAAEAEVEAAPEVVAEPESAPEEEKAPKKAPRRRSPRKKASE